MNQKEDRMLQKTIQTLELEKTFSMKLHDLERKQMRVGQKRMRNRVKTIRTHLQREDIERMQMQELQGRFRPEYTPMTSTGAVRIVAATRRLKLMTNEELRDLVRADLSTESTTVIPLSRPHTPAASMRDRSRSVPRDLQLSGKKARTTSATLKTLPNVKKPRSMSNSDDVSSSRASHRTDSDETSDDVSIASPRPVSARVTHFADDVDEVDGRRSVTSRPGSECVHGVTTKGFLSVRPTTSHVTGASRLPPTTPRSRRPKTSLGVVNGLNYSSHKVRMNPEDRCRRESVLSTSSLGSEIAREKAAEFRKELLSDEQEVTRSLDAKRRGFLTRIDTWVEEMQRQQMSTSPRAPLLLDGDDTSAEGGNDAGMSEWAKLRRCRWLRLGEGEADLSGVTTLVRDQLKQLQGLRIAKFS